MQYILTAAQSITGRPSMIWDSKLPEPVMTREVTVFVGIGALSNADKYELHQEPIAVGSRVHRQLIYHGSRVLHACTEHSASWRNSTTRAPGTQWCKWVGAPRVPRVGRCAGVGVGPAARGCRRASTGGCRRTRCGGATARAHSGVPRDRTAAKDILTHGMCL